MIRKGRPMSSQIQVIARAIDIVDVLSNGPATLTEISARTGLPKGTTFRILSSLAYGDRIAKDPVGNRYMLGPGIWRLAQRATDGLSSIATVARPALRELWEESQETVTLHSRLGLERVCVDVMPSPQQINYTSVVGGTAPIYVGSSGKVLLAFMPADERERILKSVSMQPITPRTIVDEDVLRREIEEVRERGWAKSAGERVAGASALSVPVRGKSGMLLSLSILGPADRLTDKRQEALLPLALGTAAAMERVAGLETD